MVNPAKRRFASELIEKFVSAEITNDALSDDFPRDKQDPALEAIWWELWQHYSDMYSHKAEGKHQLSLEEVELFRRSVLFLRSNLEYEWPAHKLVSWRHFALRVMGIAKRMDKRLDEEFRSHGDYQLWPFIRREDYAECVKRQRNNLIEE